MKYLCKYIQKILVICIIIHIFAFEIRIFIHYKVEAPLSNNNLTTFDMTREELLILVNKELGSTKLTISEKTINEELDDVLEDFGEDEASNAKLVTKVANRLKRMDGNLHSDVSQQVKEYKKKARERKKAKGTEPDDEDPNDDDTLDEEDMPEWAKKLMGEVRKEREAREQKEAADAKKALVNSIKEGLKAKFEKANIPLNSFFVKTALDKLEIPDSDADVKELIGKAEVLYNADLKEAGISPDTKPRSGGSGAGGTGTVDEHEFDDVAAIRSRHKPKDE